MKILRTPDERFADLPDFPYEPHYTDIADGEGGTLRIHHVDAGPSDAPVVLCMHGQPTWRSASGLVCREGSFRNTGTQGFAQSTTRFDLGIDPHEWPESRAWNIASRDRYPVPRTMWDDTWDRTDHKVQKARNIIALRNESASLPKRLAEMLNAIKFSDASTAAITEIWTINPMPKDGFTQQQLASVNLAEAESPVGPNGETLRQMIRDNYHCSTVQQEDKYLRRFIAS